MTKKIFKKTTSAPKKKAAVKKITQAAKKDTKAKERKTTNNAPMGKKPVKKIIRKITIRRGGQKKELVTVQESSAFYAVNGAVVHSLLELHDELETMLEEEFFYHFTPDDNHYSMWIRETLLDEDCARDFEKAITRRKARAVLKKHLKKYSY